MPACLWWRSGRPRLTKPVALVLRGLFRLHHRQLRRESITKELQPATFPINLRSTNNLNTMSLSYGTGGATAALGVVGLCM